MNIAINGLGRIGRNLIKILLLDDTFQIRAINDLMPIDMAAYFLKYDSTYGKSDLEISVSNENTLCINGKIIQYSSVSEIPHLNWSHLNIDTAINCSGTNKLKPQLEQYLQIGVRHVILSSPPESDDIPIVIHGYNHSDVLALRPTILSNASCTTYCVAPILDIIERNLGIHYAHFTTIHCYTSDQNLQDSYHPDYRRSRSAGVNIIPTTTSATRVIKKIFPSLKDCISGSSYRVPVINGSITEFIIDTKQSTDIPSLIAVLNDEIQSRYQGIVGLTEDKIVSSDILNCPLGAVIDIHSIEIIQGHKLKMTALYDNESGYSNQLVQILKLMNS